MGTPGPCLVVTRTDPHLSLIYTEQRLRLTESPFSFLRGDSPLERPRLSSLSVLCLVVSCVEDLVSVRILAFNPTPTQTSFKFSVKRRVSIIVLLGHTPSIQD